MGMEAVIARQIDGELYAPNNWTTIHYPVRKWKDRPALTVGQRVYIERLTFEDSGYYTLMPRCLVRTEDGAKRWIDGANLNPVIEI